MNENNHAEQDALIDSQADAVEQPEHVQRPTERAGMPHNEKAERAVLGAMLIDNAIIPEVCVTVSETAFHITKNRTCYNAIKDVWNNTGVADQVTVTTHLQDAGKLDAVGQSHIAELAGGLESPTGEKWKTHADILNNYQNRRKLKELSQQIATLSDAGNVETAMSNMRDYLEKATVETAQTDWDDMPTVAEFVQRVGNEDVTYLVDGLLMENSTAILASDPGAGKSIWAMMLSYCVASGNPFLGRKVLQGGVLYFDYEMAEKLLSWRLGAVARGLGVELNTLDKFRINALSTADLSTERGINTLSARIAAVKPSLIVFDTLRRAMGGLRENQSDDMAQIMQNLNEIKKRTGHNFTVLYLHHTVKDSEKQGLERVRGSGDLNGQVDQVFLLDQQGDIRTLESPKMRHGQDVLESYKMIWDKQQITFENETPKPTTNENGEFIQSVGINLNEGGNGELSEKEREELDKLF